MITRINMFSSEHQQADALAKFLTELTTYIEAANGCHGVELYRHSKELEDFVIIEHWQDKFSHEQCVSAFPKDKMQVAIKLLAKPPTGAYYQQL